MFKVFEFVIWNFKLEGNVVIFMIEQFFFHFFHFSNSRSFVTPWASLSISRVGKADDVCISKKKTMKTFQQVVKKSESVQILKKIFSLAKEINFIDIEIFISSLACNVCFQPTSVLLNRKYIIFVLQNFDFGIVFHVV